MNDIAAAHRYQGTQVALLDPSNPSRKEGAADKAANSANRNKGEFQAFGNDGFTFSDFLDIINPLQHIPLVSTFYRNATGDTIDPGSQIVGGTLFGGPIGAIASIINVAVGEATGMDVGEHAVALFSDKPPGSPESPESIDTTFAETNPLANFETAAGMPGKNAYAAPTGAEVAILDTEHLESFATTDPLITGAEIELLKAEAGGTKQDAVNVAKNITIETGAETAILEAEAREITPVAELLSSPVTEKIEVTDWARAETRIAAEKRATSNNSSIGDDIGAIAAGGGWFAEAKAVPKIAGQSLSPVAAKTEVLDWARAETRIAAVGKKQAVPDKAFTGAVAARGGWFAEANYSAAARYRHGAELKSTAKNQTMNFLK